MKPRFIQVALLCYALIILAVLTLSPFDFTWPSRWIVSWWSDRADAPVNFILFLPVGYFFRLALPRHRSAGVLAGGLFGLAVSLAIEICQLFLETRLTSLFDVLGNALGAAAGAGACNVLRRTADVKLPGLLTLDLPLINLIYMLLPLMWLCGTGVSSHPTRVWALAPLSVVGVVVLAGLWRHRFHRALRVPRAIVMLLTMAWFAVGAIAAALVAADIVLKIAALVLLLTAALLYLKRPHDGQERRFEAGVLRAAWPWYLGYLVLITVDVELPGFLDFDYAMGYPRQGFDRSFTLRVAEQLAAVTLLGYLIAESFGRSPQPSRVTLHRNIVLVTVCALILETVHGAVPGERASLARGVLSALAGAFGVYMYTSQLNVVRVLRGQGD